MKNIYEIRIHDDSTKNIGEYKKRFDLVAVLGSDEIFGNALRNKLNTDEGMKILEENSVFSLDAKKWKQIDFGDFSLNIKTTDKSIEETANILNDLDKPIQSPNAVKLKKQLIQLFQVNPDI